MRRLVCATVIMTLMAAQLQAADEFHLGYDQPMQSPARAGCPTIISRIAAPVANLCLLWLLRRRRPGVRRQRLRTGPTVRGDGTIRGGVCSITLC